MKRSKKLLKWYMIIASSMAMTFPLWKGITPLTICETFFFFALIFIWFDWCSE